MIVVQARPSSRNPAQLPERRTNGDLRCVLVLLGDVSAYGAAIIAGVSAVTGGALTAGANLWAETLHRRREDERDAQRDKREVRQATRLVLAELAEISGAIRQTAKSHLTWREDRPLPAFAWREYRAILASHLPLHAWRWVEMAYNDANALNWRVMEMNREVESEGPAHFIESEWLRDPFRTTRHAMQELEVALGDPRGAFGYTGYASIEDLEEGVWEPRSDPELEPTE
jgi:hypothetical protein